ncbi:MAG: patatin-like phospholipase family protein, partial [candidate division WOR-3 bacterium]
QKEVFLSLAVFKNSLLSVNDMRECVKAFISDIDLRETIIPYAAAAVDLISGEQVVLKKGPLITAVMASCAVPGFLPPIRWNGQILVDGGVVDAVPARLVRDGGANVVIAVDVGLAFYQPFNIEDGIDVINRAAEIMNFHLSRQSRDCADVLIEPPVRHVEWVNFFHYKELIHMGEKAAESKIDEIRKLLQHPFRKKVFRWIKKYV